MSFIFNRNITLKIDLYIVDIVFNNEVEKKVYCWPRAKLPNCSCN